MPRAKAAGKYDAVMQGLQKLAPQDLTYQQKVDTEKANLSKEATALALGYIHYREVKKELEEELSAINVMIEAHEQALADSQEAQSAGWGDYGVKENALKLQNGTVIRVQPEPYAQVKDKESYRVWCIKNGYERQMHLWPSTTNAVVKERLLSGEPTPDGCEAFIKTKIVLVKGDE